jgi:hypothetical protein|tara:strand:+ start:821 stop:1384 length:564 start_codon:yes stop_codon:yes gene_type:complete
MSFQLYKRNQKSYVLSLFSLVFIFLLSCNIPEDSFENPLDLDANAAKGIFPPALVFSSDSLDVIYGESFTVDLYALEIDSVAGAQIEIEYFASSIAIDSVNKGDFFQGDNDPIFIVEDANGKLTIYVTYLGTDKLNVSGTGVIASVSFRSIIQGVTFVKVSASSILLDQNANPIEIKGLGQAKINAK